MKKLLLALCLMLALLVSVAAAENFGLEAGEYRSDKEEYKDIAPMQAGNYWYIELKDGTAEIVKYTGSDKELMIPAKLNGLNVTSIGFCAFKDCGLLTSVVIPKGVTCIGDLSFRNCYSMTNVTIPDSVTIIKVSAFFDCSSLTDLLIPDSVMSIEQCAFMGCTSLTNVVISNYLDIIEGKTFFGCTSLTSITIPCNITTIDMAFENCVSLTSVTIPDSVITIDDYAFRGCPNLVLSVTAYSAAEKYAKENNIPYIYTPATEGWTCTACLNYNEADFCTECGTAKPEPTATPAPTPVNDGSWDCTCGSHNTGKFCGKCGTKRPDLTICPSCGHQSEGPANSFCTECGAQF